MQFLVENIETTQLRKQFDVILSTWLGYMYVKNVPKAIQNISHHLKDNGVFLLIRGYPKDEFGRMIDMLTGKTTKPISFYNELEQILSQYFTFKKHILRGQLVFLSTADLIQKFQLELQNEHGIIMDKHHEQQLKDYLKNKDKLTIGYDSLAYLCKHTHV